MRERTNATPGNSATSNSATWSALLVAGALAGFGLGILSRDAWEAFAERVAYTAIIAAFLFAGAALAFLLQKQSADSDGAPADAAAGLAWASGIDDPVIDEGALEALKRLGDDAFVSEVVSQFVSEGVSVLMNIARAVGDADAAQFASLAHALRSSAANVGAKRLYRLCLDWRELPRAELVISGPARFVRLQQEFDAAQRALRAWQFDGPQRGPAESLAQVTAGQRPG